MPNAAFVRAVNPYQIRVLQDALDAGAIRHLRSGMSGWFNSTIGAATGDSANLSTGDLITATKPNTIQFLDGVPVYWSPASQQTNFKAATNTQDFFLGTAYGDASLASTSMSVMMNTNPPPLYYDWSLLRDECVPPVIVGTQGLNTMGVFTYNAAPRMILSTTNQAQKMDLLAVKSFPVASRSIIRLCVNVLAGGAGGAQDFNIGVASGTNATDFDSITQYVALHINGNDNKIYFQSKDGTTTVAATDSTKTFTAGTPFEAWLDMRNPLSVGMYVDAVQVLVSTTFNVVAAALPWLPIVHLEKTAAADVFEVSIPWLMQQNASQGVSGV